MPKNSLWIAHSYEHFYSKNCKQEHCKYKLFSCFEFICIANLTVRFVGIKNIAHFLDIQGSLLRSCALKKHENNNV